MNKLLLPIITSILILGTTGISYDVFADRDSNNGNNGCEKSNPNSKACEKNPNTAPQEPTIDPTSGPLGTQVTITDPQGRIQQGDVMVFYIEGTDPIFGTIGDNNNVSADGTTITANIPSTLTVELQYFVNVGPDVNTARFNSLPFFVTFGSVDPDPGI